MKQTFFAAAVLFGFFSSPAFSQPVEKAGTLIEAVKVPLLMNGKQVGASTAAVGTKVKILKEDAGKFFVSTPAGSIWVEAAKVQLAQGGEPPPAPVSSPQASAPASQPGAKSPAPQNAPPASVSAPASQPGPKSPASGNAKPAAEASVPGQPFANENRPDRRIRVTVQGGADLAGLVPVRLPSDRFKDIPDFNFASAMVVDPEGKPGPGPAPAQGGALLPSAVVPTGPNTWALTFAVPMTPGKDKTVEVVWLTDRPAPVRLVSRCQAWSGGEPWNTHRTPGIESELFTVGILSPGCNNVWLKKTPSLFMGLITTINKKNLTYASGETGPHIFKDLAGFGLGGFKLNLAGDPISFSLLESWAENGASVCSARWVWSALPLGPTDKITSPRRSGDPRTAPAPAQDVTRDKQRVRIIQDMRVCAGDAFVLQTLTVDPVDDDPWELQVGMAKVEGAQGVNCGAWLGQWKPGRVVDRITENDEKERVQLPGLGVALMQAAGSKGEAFDNDKGSGWIFKGKGQQTLTFLLSGYGGAVCRQDDGPGAMGDFLDGEYKKYQAVENLQVSLGKPEPVARPADAALTELAGYLFNTTSLASERAVEVVAQDYGVSLPAGAGVVAEVDGQSVPCDVVAEPGGRQRIVFLPPPVPAAKCVKATLKTGGGPPQPGFKVKDQGGRLEVTSGDSRTWVFTARGLEEIRAPGRPPVLTGESADGAAEPDPSLVPKVVFNGRHLCIVNYGDPAKHPDARQYRLYNSSPFWTVTHKDGFACALHTQGLWIANWYDATGAYPSSASDVRSITGDIFSDHDWLCIGSKDSQLWVAPTLSAPRIEFNKDIPRQRFLELSVAGGPMASEEDWVFWRSDIPKGDALTVVGDQRRQAYIWRNLPTWGHQFHPRGASMFYDMALYQGGPRGTTLYGLTADPSKDGNRLVVTRHEPKFMVPEPQAREKNTFVHRSDWNADGCTDSLYCVVLNGDAPSLESARWYFDTNSDGSYQSVFEFSRSKDKKVFAGERDGEPDRRRCEVFLDSDETYNMDSCVDLERQEGKWAAIVLEDQSEQNGIFCDGDVFFGGINQRNRVYQRWAIGSGYDLSMETDVRKDKKGGVLYDKVAGEEARTKAFGRPWMMMYSMDIDNDGEWDLTTWGNFPINHGHTINVAHIPLINGSIYNPTSGAYYTTLGTFYTAPAAQINWCSRVWKDEKSGEWQQPHWYDCPQADLNLDDDPAPEAHVMCPVVVLPNKFGYLHNRMGLDLRNSNAGRPNSPYVGSSGDTNYYGHSTDVNFCPKIFGTSHQGTTRCPSFPDTPSAFKDKWGNSYSSSNIYLPRDWDGKALKTFNKDGKPNDWVYGWQWAVAEAEWDTVGAVWSPFGDNNPEAMQIYFPSERPWIRFDQWVRPTLTAPTLKDWKVYQNPLTGWLHLRGSQFGFWAGDGDRVTGPAVTQPPEVYNTRWAKESYWEYSFDFSQWSHDVEFCRATVAPFEAYFDNGADGVFNVAMADFENDGLYDRRAWYDIKEKMVTLADSDGFAYVPAALAFPEESPRLDRYKSLVERYKQTIATRKDSWMDKAITSGTDPDYLDNKNNIIDYSPRQRRAQRPIEQFYAVVSPSDMPAVALDNVHDPAWDGLMPDPKSQAADRNRATCAWSQFYMDGYSRLFTSLSRHQVVFRLLQAPWSTEALQNVRMLVLPGLNPAKPVAAAEAEALDAWLKGGGVLVTSYPSRNEAACDEMNALLGRYGVALGAERVLRDLSNDEWFYDMGNAKTPAQDWQIEKLGCFQNVHRIWYDAGVFAACKEAEPILTDSGRPVAVRAKVGKGWIYAFGSDWMLNNRHNAIGSKAVVPLLAFSAGTVPRQGMTMVFGQPNNNRYLDQMVDHLASSYLKPSFTMAPQAGSSLSLQNGEPMDVMLPKAFKCQVDGKPAASAQGNPAYLTVKIPPGQHVLSGSR
ncbi:MAG: hypothetical protein WCS65_02090 [Verrucomicrobiae bacterium]